MEWQRGSSSAVEEVCAVPAVGELVGEMVAGLGEMLQPRLRCTEAPSSTKSTVQRCH